MTSYEELRAALKLDDHSIDAIRTRHSQLPARGGSADIGALLGEVDRLRAANATFCNALMSIVSYDGKLDGYEAARTWRTASDALKAVKP